MRRNLPPLDTYTFELPMRDREILASAGLALVVGGSNSP